VKPIVLSVPKFGFIVATRAALGVGIGLLAASRFRRQRRRVLGKSLIAAGAVATIPAAFFLRQSLMSRNRSAAPSAHSR
jgi:hypothetical protein